MNFHCGKQRMRFSEFVTRKIRRWDTLYSKYIFNFFLLFSTLHLFSIAFQNNIKAIFPPTLCIFKHIFCFTLWFHFNTLFSLYLVYFPTSYFHFSAWPRITYNILNKILYLPISIPFKIYILLTLFSVILDSNKI